MCGIVGLFAKSPEIENQLGVLLSSMLGEMCERGPDSAGIAIYKDPVSSDQIKLTLYHHDEDLDWQELTEKITSDLKGATTITPHVNHAIVETDISLKELHDWLSEFYPDIRINSSGHVIEIYKEKGWPKDLIDNYNIKSLKGTHALGHTRMATESHVTTEHSHPFSTGEDLCLVHNGSLSNHNRLRNFLKQQGIEFQTDNDSEVAAGYLTWRIRQGDDLVEALEAALEDLDGFYTFAIGTKDGFAVIRDPIGCKPAIMAETDDWAAMASEFRSIAHLPGAENARIWEPEPTKIYSWKRD